MLYLQGFICEVYQTFYDFDSNINRPVINKKSRPSASRTLAARVSYKRDVYCEGYFCGVLNKWKFQLSRETAQWQTDGKRILSYRSPLDPLGTLKINPI